MENYQENVVEKLERDEFYGKYLDPHSKNVLTNSLTLREQVKKLSDGIELLSLQLEKQVLEKHEDLLQQANHASKLEGVLETMNTHVKNLFANAERLRMQIHSPYNELEKHTKVLGHLHLASHILRQVNRLQQLSKRLSNTNDPVQKATLLHELEQLASDPELTDIDAVTSELRNIRSHQQKVVQLATGSLNQGIINENITQTTTALQIFINLGTVKSVVESIVEHNLYECRESLKSAFAVSSVNTMKSKGGPGHISLMSMPNFRTKAWAELRKVFSEDIYQMCQQVKFLQTTLNNLHLPNSNFNIATDFWGSLGKILQEEIKKSSSAIQQMLEEDYPKLLKCYFELTKKTKYDPFPFEHNVLRKLENSYLSTSLTRMLDPTQAMFSSETNLPTHDQIDSLIRVITSELSVALIEENLSEQISKNVAKCIKMYAVKTEQQLETGPDAAQVIAGTANTGQQKNLNLSNDLFYLKTQIQRMLSNMKESLPESCVKIIEESIQSLDNLVGAILQPLIASVNSVIDTIIITMHLETDWAKIQLPNKTYHSCSPYMRELTQFITRVYQIYLADFKNTEVLTTKCSEIAVRTIDLFVRHTALLRPLSSGGRLRLQADYQHLEAALRAVCPHLPDLGRPYRLLKSMASLVVLPPEEVVGGQTSGGSVPYSTALLLLFAHAGPELGSPHHNTGWSLPKVSAWLDEHPSEADRLDLVAGALQRYEGLVRQKNSASYDPVYPVMAQFLERALKEIRD
ncbi:unnamed protein product [Phaedon cochleariae]|uniref:Conserved oligomeric Golgi complex subunit 5 n=1 Tax=Phaedon cochleariae TaxID=80249 RepID=A0A9N9SME1_PHACE|nr:unnamed protein product [Phaedon cochleariae]